MTEPEDHGAKPVALGFCREGILLPLSAVVALKSLRPTFRDSAKYRQILTSVRVVGLVEPPTVWPDPDNPGRYFLLDGHLRIEALKDLKIETVQCLVSTDDEAFTYNKRINRLAALQEHRMIRRAIQRGVPEERLALALGVNVSTIQRRASLMDGICEEAGRLLRDATCPIGVFEILRKMTAARQAEAAELMLGHNNFSRSFLLALLAATPPTQLVKPGKPNSSKSVSREQVARLERELASLQMKTKAVDESLGVDTLHLTVAKGYLTKLLGNPRIVRWLAQHQSDFLSEFQAITELADAPASIAAE